MMEPKRVREWNQDLEKIKIARAWRQILNEEGENAMMKS